MSTSTFFSCIRIIPAALGLLAVVCPFNGSAQHQPLPVAKEMNSPLRKTVQVHRQAVSASHVLLTPTTSLSNQKYPSYSQPITNSHDPLITGDGQRNEQKRIVQPRLAKPSGNSLPIAGSTSNVKKIAALAPGSPVGTPDQYAVYSDKTLSIAAPGFLANDIDLNGETLTGTAITNNVDHGTLAAFADGSFTYTPTAGFTGTDTFAYTMKDASNNVSAPITVTIEVLPAANRTPIGSPDVYTALSGTSLSIAAPGFLANDIDPDGETITATAITDNVDHGTLAAFADGSFTYTPNAGFTGTDAFSYQMKDASNHFSAPVTVTINVVEGNRPPVGINDAYTAVINTTLSIAAPGFLANDVDPDGDAITATVITDNVDHGTLAAFADGSFSYTPTTGYTGVDSFSYKMKDVYNNSSDVVTVTITVSAAGTLPVGTPDSYAVPSDKTLSIAAPGFLANDIDLNGETLTATAITNNVDHGTLAAFADGSFTYTPTAGFTGTDAFAYTMRDASNNVSAPITVTIEVLPAANRTPVGSPDVYTARSGTSLSSAAPGFLANDIDPDGETITATAITNNVDHGTLAAFADGSFTYTPTAGFTGTDTFAYTMKDGSNHSSAPVTVTINVLEGNRPPVGINDAYTAVINTTLSIAAPGFLANDVDPDGDAITATVITNNVDHGTLAAFADGSFTYTPTTGYTGADTFSYKMKDAYNNSSDVIIVSINVVSPNRPPVANAGSDQSVECDGSGGATVTLDASASSDPDNDILTYTWRESGTIIAGPTTETKTKVFLSLGVHTLELTADDGNGASSTDNVTITVADNTPPTVTAALVPKPGDREVFTVSCSSNDACDTSLATSSVITLPKLSSPKVTFQVKKSGKIKIDLSANKVLVQAPDPQGFWANIIAAGGVSVINGQSLSLKYNKDNYSFIFDKNGNLKSVEGPIIVLQCTATDGSGNTAKATAAVVPGSSGTALKLAPTGNEVTTVMLAQNYPNPFKYETIIGFSLTQGGPVRLAVYDSKGQLVQTLVNAVMTSGHHEVTWNAHRLPAGIYYYRIYTGPFVETGKMILLK